MYFAISKDDFAGGPENEDLEKEIFEKLSPKSARKLMVLLKFPELLKKYLSENTDPEMKELWDVLEFFREAEKGKRDKETQNPSDESAHTPAHAPDEAPATPGAESQEPAEPQKQPSKGSEENKKKSAPGKPEKDSKRKRSHAGARGVKAFPGAKKEQHPLFGLCAGGSCPCKKGKLYSIPPSNKVRFEAKALLEAVLHLRERLRCNECGNVFGAILPPELTEREHYQKATPEAAALCILGRYALGIPDLRLERLQEWLGTPLSNSRQFAMALQGFLTLKPLWDHWLTSLAQCPTLTCDDAFQKVIALQQDIREEVERASELGILESQIRTGVQATIVVGKSEQGHEIHAYLTGREHQGESLHGLLERRSKDLPPPALTTDAAAKASAMGPFPEKDSRGFHLRSKKKSSAPKETSAFHAHCLQHLRLAFEGIKNHHPDVTARALELIGHVYANDSQAKTFDLPPEGRRDFHAAHSGPVMQALEIFLNGVSQEPRAEPNSDLGRVLAYARNHWSAFTEFTRTPGVALDTNACERDVYFVILHRLNSLHYQTPTGAKVGDFFMSLAATCRSHKVNPLEYLSACLDFPDLVRHAPQNWMPWNFKETLSPARELRNKEWADLAEARRAKGYTQLVRTRKNNAPEEQHNTPPSHSIEAR